MAPKRAKRGWLAFTVLFIATRATDSVRHHARFTTALPKGSGPTPKPKATRPYRTAPVSYVATISRNNAYYCFSVAECTLLCSVSGRAGLEQHKGAVIGVPSIISSSEHYPSTFPVSLKSRRHFFFTANGVKLVKRYQRLSRLSKTFLPATLALVLSRVSVSWNLLSNIHDSGSENCAVRNCGVTSFCIWLYNCSGVNPYILLQAVLMGSLKNCLELEEFLEKILDNSGQFELVSMHIPLISAISFALRGIQSVWGRNRWTTSLLNIHLPNQYGQCQGKIHYDVHRPPVWFGWWLYWQRRLPHGKCPRRVRRCRPTKAEQWGQYKSKVESQLPAVCDLPQGQQQLIEQ